MPMLMPLTLPNKIFFQNSSCVALTKMVSHSPSQQQGYPVEILLLIFEQLHCISPASLRHARLASKLFDALATPIVYRHVILNPALVKCFKEDDDQNSAAGDLRTRVGNAIRTFTRQITIDRKLDWSSVVNMLLCLDKFHHLNWCFWTDSDFSARRSVPPSILDCLAERWPSASISASSDLDITNNFACLPPHKLDSLKMSLFRQRRPNLIERRLKNFLLQCDRLKVLHLLNVQCGARFLDEEIAMSERLPAIEELFLQGYFWLHPPKIAFWNFSRLTSLRLEKVFIINFLESIFPEDLLQLRSLETDGHCESAVDHTKVSDIPPTSTSTSNNPKIL